MQTAWSSVVTVKYILFLFFFFLNHQQTTMRLLTTVIYYTRFNLKQLYITRNCTNGINLQASMSLQGLESNQFFKFEIHRLSELAQFTPIIYKKDSLNGFQSIYLSNSICKLHPQFEVFKESQFTQAQLEDKLGKIIETFKNQITSDIFLQICYLWYEANEIRASKLIEYIIDLLTERINHMDVDTFARFMFINGLRRNQMKPKLALLSQRYFRDNFDQLSTQNVSLICYGYFRSQTRTDDPQLHFEIIDRLEKTENFDDFIIYANIFKFLRFTKVQEACMKLRLFIENLKVEKLGQVQDLQSLIHLIKLGESYFAFNDEIFDSIVHRTLNQDNIRLKDISEVLRCCCAFNRLPSQDVLNYLAKFPIDPNQRKVYPAFFINFTTHLAMLGVIRDDLIELIFNDHFLSDHSSK